ncbi:piggyBac transposable element-derived protein 3-like [Melanaphis sacchari]|uniref:piggyBac transposable element-derived protein 3-like n=1 Tax=Melanaphis sacchari TaxID=742174 RepID=UPI000DC13C08|nr:piggyBac transposable element-derived protein 3-like [Melanaphis sacchari]
MLGTNIKEIKDLVGISLIMGIVKMPAYTDNWAPSTKYGQVSNVMSLRRYQQLMRCLHFCDNNCPDDFDRFFKVRKLLDIIRNNCLSVPQGKRFSVDEMMIPYKGKKAGSRKQYIKNKPKKWGYKMFVRAGIDGMVYDFLIYSGNCTFRGITFSPREMSYFGLGPRVVIALSISIPDKPMSVIYFDNFFTTPELISYLRSEFGILSLGTIRKQHLRGCPLIEDKKLMKQPRGTYEYLCDKSKKVIILKWLDNKVVSLASSYTQESKSNTNIIQRYSKDAKKGCLFHTLI